MPYDFTPDFSALRTSASGPEEYGRFQQHLGLLEDTVRIASFYEAIKSESPGSCVLDVGAGTGILSLMALKLGYEHAVLIEPSKKISAYARYLLDLHGFSGRYTIINRPLEQCVADMFPQGINLVVSEVLSSLLFGFGCWKSMGQLLKVLDPRGTIIPLEGNLLGFLATRDYSYRPEQTSGIGFLRNCGINVDLHLRTFRSGGNIPDKSLVNYELSNRSHKLIELGRFYFREEWLCETTGASIVSKSDAQLIGIMTFWEVTLCRSRPWLRLCSRDPSLSSWCPFFIPFVEPVKVKAGEGFNVELQELSIDAPYPSAFRLMINNKPATHTLYW